MIFWTNQKTLTNNNINAQRSLFNLTGGVMTKKEATSSLLAVEHKLKKRIKSNKFIFFNFTYSLDQTMALVV